jgi:hypothetical protein
MIRKLSAALLVALALSPFTAPFSTCDVATMFGCAGTHRTETSKTAVTTDTSVSIVPSIVTRTTRAKTLVTTHRHILSALGHEPSAQGRPDESTHALTTRSVLTTILRV